MVHTATNVIIDIKHKAILQAILYFDIFKYPLKKNEIWENCKIQLSPGDLENSLNELLTLDYVKQVKDYVMPHWADITNVERRQKGNVRATEMMKEAYKRSAKAARLPFIKGLCISGSLSKNYFDDNSDIDFFVITKANRLWICRSLFVVFYKLLPAHKKPFYCLNYFISEADLRIDDKNIFVATELAHLDPTFGYDAYKQLLDSNSWYKDWVTNKPENNGVKCREHKKGILKTVIESLFIGRFGDWCDNFLQKETARRWARRHSNDMDKKQFEVNYRSRKHAAKRHEKGYQDKVLSALAQKIKDMEDTFQQKLN
jgi:hypothetical protein